MKEVSDTFTEAKLEIAEPKFLAELQQEGKKLFASIPRVYSVDENVGVNEAENAYREIILEAINTAVIVYHQNYVDAVAAIKGLQVSKRLVESRLRELRKLGEKVIGSTKGVTYDNLSFEDEDDLGDLATRVKNNFLKAISIYKTQTEFFVSCNDHKIRKIPPAKHSGMSVPSYQYLRGFINETIPRAQLYARMGDLPMRKVSSQAEYDEIVRSSNQDEVSFYA
jgi:hypothetical protein